MVPTVWIEQTTYRLQGGCSTTELCGHEKQFISDILAEAIREPYGTTQYRPNCTRCFPFVGHVDITGMPADKKTALLGGAASGKHGAEKRSRTPDLRITNALLYQLSYFGDFLKSTTNSSLTC